MLMTPCIGYLAHAIALHIPEIVFFLSKTGFQYSVSHVPCRSNKCCRLQVVGDSPNAAVDASTFYVKKLLHEIRTTAVSLDRCGSKSSTTSSDAANADGFVRQIEGVNTLYFGGGTPSLCPPELVGEVIETVRRYFGIAPGAEISIEMDPGTFDEVRWLGRQMAMHVVLLNRFLVSNLDIMVADA